ncbi:uncharacterized protein LOC127007974 [Eriocheir sinensis]|uniref:uncharacterized protein LOC127007974 n=1 Tax=Eriocheir sinensis TaxID=95602 RepID=UPI0021C566EE|nr:uncharacterized protein LOC127007974 [Eriocheir sinensis]
MTLASPLRPATPFTLTPSEHPHPVITTRSTRPQLRVDSGPCHLTPKPSLLNPDSPPPPPATSPRNLNTPTPCHFTANPCLLNPATLSPPPATSPPIPATSPPNPATSPPNPGTSPRNLAC